MSSNRLFVSSSPYFGERTLSIFFFIALPVVSEFCKTDRVFCGVKSGSFKAELFISNLVACLFGFNELAEGQEPYSIDNSDRCLKYPVENKVKHTYQLVIWLEETGFVQQEQGLLFEGTVVIEVSGGVNTDEYIGGQITGTE